MLVSFTFENHGSFKNEATIDMRAVPADKDLPGNLIATWENEKIIKVASVYGANASGKTQFVDAFSCFRRIVRNSFNGFSQRTEDYYAPFLFVPNAKHVPVEYEISLLDDMGQYRYGFAHDDARVLEEWLYFESSETHRVSRIIERAGDEISLGKSVRGKCSKYLDGIKSDSLALSFFRRLSLGVGIFDRVYDAICSCVVVPSRMCTLDINRNLNYYFLYDYEEQDKEQLLGFLRAVDFGITDIVVERSNEEVSVFTYHRGAEGESYRASLDIESTGTKKMISLYAFFAKAIKENCILVVDELDAQLHPLLLRHLVSLFNRSDTRGQLIYTSHDTTLLDSTFMRRDQIWIVEKDDEGRSTLYSVAEFKPRKDRRLGKAYLSGVFGGVPAILSDYVVGGHDGD